MEQPEEEATAQRRLAFLLGNPVTHSFSPIIHNAAFKALGIDAKYRAVQVSRENLPATIERLRAGNVLGANVTIPYKKAVIGMVDSLTRDAMAIGAVNTIVVGADGRFLGANTDVEGFIIPLGPHLESLRGGSAVILGAGGAARAAAFALLMKAGLSRLTVVTRQPGRAIELIDGLAAADVNGVFQAATIDEAASAVRDCRLVVNATPVGMTPVEDLSPWPNHSDFHDRHVVYDLVYAPTETRLMRDAEARGAQTIGGLPMLLAQAAASFKLWTGREMPMEDVREALRGTF